MTSSAICPSCACGSVGHCPDPGSTPCLARQTGAQSWRAARHILRPTAMLETRVTLASAPREHLGAPRDQRSSKTPRGPAAASSGSLSYTANVLQHIYVTCMRTCSSKSAHSPTKIHPASSPIGIALRIACSPFSRVSDYADYSSPDDPCSMTQARHLGIIGQSAFPGRELDLSHRSRPKAVAVHWAPRCRLAERRYLLNTDQLPSPRDQPTGIPD